MGIVHCYKKKYKNVTVVTKLVVSIVSKFPPVKHFFLLYFTRKQFRSTERFIGVQYVNSFNFCFFKKTFSLYGTVYFHLKTFNNFCHFMEIFSLHIFAQGKALPTQRIDVEAKTCSFTICRDNLPLNKIPPPHPIWLITKSGSACLLS